MASRSLRSKRQADCGEMSESESVDLHCAQPFLYTNLSEDFGEKDKTTHSIEKISAQK